MTTLADITECDARNSLQLRSYVGSKNGIGLANLCNQYALHGEEMKIRKNERGFAVELPLIV